MEEKKTLDSTNEELLNKAKEKKSNTIVNALLIGVVIGILIYGFAKSTLSFIVLIPLYFAYRAFNKSGKKGTPEE